MPAAHKTLLLELPEVSINRGESHGAGSVFQKPMELLPTHFVAAATQSLKKALLSLSARCRLGRHGDSDLARIGLDQVFAGRPKPFPLFGVFG